MYLDIKENTEERKFGVIIKDEYGFVNPIYYTRNEWEKIIKAIEKEIMDYDVSQMFQK